MFDPRKLEGSVGGLGYEAALLMGAKDEGYKVTFQDHSVQTWISSSMPTGSAGVSGHFCGKRKYANGRAAGLAGWAANLTVIFFLAEDALGMCLPYFDMVAEGGSRVFGSAR